MSKELPRNNMRQGKQKAETCVFELPRQHAIGKAEAMYFPREERAKGQASLNISCARAKKAQTNPKQHRKDPQKEEQWLRPLTACKD